MQNGYKNYLIETTESFSTSNRQVARAKQFRTKQNKGAISNCTDETMYFAFHLESRNANKKGRELN